MTTFLDGPAAGVKLLLRRAPLLLRAVQGADGKWDALDQLDDAPQPGEQLFAYRLHGQRNAVHVDISRGRSAWFRGGDYRLVEPQPDDRTMRDLQRWRAWAETEVARL